MGWSEIEFAGRLAANDDLRRRNPNLGFNRPVASPQSSLSESPPEPLATQPASKAAKSHARKLALAMSEADLLSNVREMARVTGWMAYHTRDSRRSDIGFPDLVMVRKNRVLFVELKSEKGKPTAAQIEWLHALMLTRRAETYLWRPSQWLDGTIEGMLR